MMQYALATLLGGALGMLVEFAIVSMPAANTQASAAGGTGWYSGIVKLADEKARTIVIDAESEYADIETVPLQFSYDGKTNFFYSINNARDDILYARKTISASENVIHAGSRIVISKSTASPSDIRAQIVVVRSL